MRPSKPNKLPNGPPYWQAIRRRARELGSDGCTFPATQIYQNACFEHDIHWRTGAWIGGEPITIDEANTVFRWRIQQMSPLGKLSPMAWWRWTGVTLWGKFKQLKEGH